jgi:hypothetical protein
MSRSSSRPRATPRGFVFRIGGRNGVGKTASLSDLINALPPNALPTFELDVDTPEPEVRS